MLRYTSGQLRTFLAVAETGSVAKAAEALVVSQPAVSSVLASLRRACGTALVEREGRGLRLTEAGRILAGYGRRLFALADEADTQVRAAANVGTVRLRLAAVTTVAEYILPQPLRLVSEKHPEIQVQLDVGNRGQVWERLANWEAQVVVSGRPPADRPFRTVARRANEIVLIGQFSESLDPNALASAPWLLREPGSGTRAMTQEFFDDLGIVPENQLTIGSNGAIRECVRAGLGIALQSRDAVRRELESRALGEVKAPIAVRGREWHVVVNAERDLPSAIAVFVGDLIDALGFVPERS
jgi:LysR family transcriptional regulator, low CO2-responsive transcriptional regulator